MYIVYVCTAWSLIKKNVARAHANSQSINTKDRATDATNGTGPLPTRGRTDDAPEHSSDHPNDHSSVTHTTCP